MSDPLVLVLGGTRSGKSRHAQSRALELEGATLNNLRDVDTDRRAGKRTLAVRLGRRGARVEYAVLLAVAAYVGAARLIDNLCVEVGDTVVEGVGQGRPQARRDAALILLNIPLALVGGIVALWLSGQNLSVPASVGFIALFDEPRDVSKRRVNFTAAVAAEAVDICAQIKRLGDHICL